MKAYDMTKQCHIKEKKKKVLEYPGKARGCSTNSVVIK